MEELAVVEEVVEEVKPTIDDAIEANPDEDVTEATGTDPETSGDIPTGEEQPGAAEPVAITPEVQEIINTKIAAAKHKERRRYQDEIKRWNSGSGPEETVAPAQPEQAAAPSPENFDNYDDYIDAKAGFIADQRFDERQKTATRQAMSNAHKQKVNTVLDSGAKKYDDFEEKTRALSSHQMNDYTLMAVTEAENGPDLAYYLASNPDEATRVASMSPAGMLMEYSRIANKLANPAPKQTTQAPDPISPVTTSGATDLQYNPNMSDKEYAQWRDQQKK